VALVKWTESVGLTLLKRDLSSMTLRTPDFRLMPFTILQMFPFTSETKRMGIVVRVRVLFCVINQPRSMCSSRQHDSNGDRLEDKTKIIGFVCAVLFGVYHYYAHKNNYTSSSYN